MDQPTQPRKPKITFLFSDTGGGHRSATEAIIEAMELEFPDRFDLAMVDVFRQYAPPPFNLAPDVYPHLSRFPKTWELGYRISDGKRRVRATYAVAQPYLRRSLDRLIKDRPHDLIVSVHQLTNVPMVRALGQENVPFVTVVTDMVSTHAAWYAPGADLIIVATEEAKRRGIEMGVDPERIKVVGLPVAEKFRRPLADKSALRAQLGWPNERPVALLVGGGEGMGPLEQVSRAIDEARLPITLIVIAGRNEALRKRLEARRWNVPVKVYGFVRQMPDFMQASDVLITKAGPGTICEAFIAGLPLILYSKMPGQEDGNVNYVVDEGAGAWAPEPELVVRTLRKWLRDPAEWQYRSQVARRLARPDAARQIARLLAREVGIERTNQSLNEL